MTIIEAQEQGFYKIGEFWYKPRTYMRDGKIFKSRQRFAEISCIVCKRQCIAFRKDGKTCSKSCHFKQFKGVRNHQWKGGGRTGDGYKWIYAPDYPEADIRGRVREHRYVMSKIIGRSLTTDEHVHHINGDKFDNRPTNLKLVSRSEHMSIHESRRIHTRTRDKSGRFTS